MLTLDQAFGGIVPRNNISNSPVETFSYSPVYLNQKEPKIKSELAPCPSNIIPKQNVSMMAALQGSDNDNNEYLYNLILFIFFGILFIYLFDSLLRKN